MPPNSKQGQFAQKVEQSLGIIPGTKLWSPFPFSGLNLEDTPPAIDDKEFSYMENFFRLGNGYLRTGWDAGTAFYKAPSGKTILPYFFWYNIGTISYLAVFFDDGTARQVRLSTGDVTTISNAPNTFYVLGENLPVCSQSGTKFLLIANNNTKNAYWIWDGSNLYQSGSVGPTVDLTSGGSNYSSHPTITPYGGVGSGVTITPTIFNGSIASLAINNPGENYVPGDIVQLQFSGGGSDTGAMLEALLGSGTVASVDVTDGGSSYSATPTITFSAPTGATATANASLDTHGHVASASISSPGAGYVSAPAVSFSGGGGAGASASALVQNGQVVQITISDGGSGYTSAPTISIAGPSGTTATGTATVAAGVITAIKVTNAGAGYVAPPTVTITDGSGAGATATAFLASGGVSAVAVVDGGTNYTFPPPLTFVGGNGVGAAAVAILTPTSVAYINVTSGGGPGYTSEPTVVFNNTGTDGSGAVATATISQGQVVQIVLTNPGSGYTSPPFITFTGGGLPTGTPDATAEAVLVGTSIASVLVGNQGLGYTQAPAVVIEPGSNNAASAILELMPFGISGSSIETFNQRVWLSDPFQETSVPTGGDFFASAPESLTDFSPSDGGVLFVNTDRFLRRQYTGIRQSNGYLYFFGDSSSSVVSNLNTSGVPATTTFSYQNVDPQIGMAWRDSIQDFGRTIVFANVTGVYGLYGGAATKLSGKLDQLFENAIFPPTAGAITPTSAVATLFNIKHYLLFFTVRDPETGVFRNVMTCWNEREWFLVSQSPQLTFIGTQEANSELNAWGTDGSAIYPLFTTPSAALYKRLTTKMYGADSLLLLKDFLGLYVQAQDQTGGVGVDLSVNFVASGVTTQPDGRYNFDSVGDNQFSSNTFANALFQEPNFKAAQPYFPLFGTGTGGFSFNTLAAQFSTNSPDFILSNLLIAYLDSTAFQ